MAGGEDRGADMGIWRWVDRFWKRPEETANRWFHTFVFMG